MNSRASIVYSFATILPPLAEYATGLKSWVMNRPANSLAQRVKLARTKRGLSQKRLAEASGMKQADISKIENAKIVKTTGIARLAAALAVAPHWLEMGADAEPDWNQVQTPGVGYDPAFAGESHQVRLQLRNVVFKATTLGSIMAGEEPGPLFSTLLEDDAMSPLYPRGVEILWSVAREPRPGRPILVRDQHGQLHVREYRQGRSPGHWIAAALHSAYAWLDSNDDALEIVAVWKGTIDPGD
jgi:transcriptional regulator with XRE-family HTH domain